MYMYIILIIPLLLLGCATPSTGDACKTTGSNLNMEHHVKHLEKCCRVCAIRFSLIPKGGKGYECLGLDPISQIPWRELLLQCFQIDPANDHTNIHPKKFCCRCKGVIKRICEAKVNHTHYVHSTEVEHWEAHSEECKVCLRFSANTRGRRVKKHRKRGRPKAVHVPIIEQTEEEPFIQTSENLNDHSYVSTAAQFVGKRQANSEANHASAKDLSDICISGVSYDGNSDICIDVSNGDYENNSLLTCSIQTHDSENSSPFTCSNSSESNCDSGLESSVHENTSHQQLYQQPLATSTPCRRGRPPLPLTSLCQNSQNQRLKPIKSIIKQHADHFDETSTQVYSTLLINHLNSEKEFRKAELVKNALIGEHELDAVSCLAIRINNFQSVNKYRKMQQAAKREGNDIYQSYFAIKKVESQFLPGSTESLFTVTPPMNHPPSGGSSIDAMAYLPTNFPDLGTPFVKVERFHYDEAIAMVIKDLESYIADGLKQNGFDPNTGHHSMTMVIKDGGDGMGDVQRKNFQSDTLLADKALRFSFCIMLVKCGDIVIYREKKPNSQTNCRPLLVALADENDYYAFTTMTQPLFDERTHLANGCMKVQHESATWNFKFKFHAAMYDEKLERKVAGLAGCASEFLCTLCESTRKDAFTDPFQYKICRNSHRNMELIDERTENDNQQSYRQLIHNSKGVVSDSFIDNTPHIDALHCEINNAVWFKKIFVREIACVQQWEKKGVEIRIAEAEDLLDRTLRQKTGLQRRLMQPGNYSRKLLEDRCVDVIISLIQVERRDAVRKLIQLYVSLKTVWKATWPKESCPDKVANYRNDAACFMDFLNSEFPYCKDALPNYVHKMVAHVDELIEKFESVGAFSSEGNEHGNKLFRMLRRMGARQNTKYELHDILKFHWLYTMKQLQLKSEGTKIPYKCSRCCKEGHNKRRCPNMMDRDN